MNPDVIASLRRKLARKVSVLRAIEKSALVQHCGAISATAELSLNKSSAVAEMAVQCSTSRIVTRWVGQCSGKIRGEVRAHGHNIIHCQKTESLRYISIADNVGPASVSLTSQSKTEKAITECYHFW